MKYKAKHKRKFNNKPVDVAIRSCIATLCAILIIVLGYYTAAFFAGNS
ncbi:MAG: hypothetical protein IK086_06790 [Clostridia bacterium]|nr:hypothetical protein [Clostridia bacterium]